LKWDDIRNGFIYLKETKTKDPRQIPVNDALDALFKRIRRKEHLNHHLSLPGEESGLTTSKRHLMQRSSGPA